MIYYGYRMDPSTRILLIFMYIIDLSAHFHGKNCPKVAKQLVRYG